MVSRKTLLTSAVLAWCAVGLAFGLGLVTRTAAAPASDARLEGAFRILGKITASNDGTRGEVKARRYVFRPLCPQGSCRKVALVREGPSNETYRSFLHRKRRSVYMGTEHSGRIGCPGNHTGSQRVRLTFRIVDERNGRATAIKGKAGFEIKCPGPDLFQRARIYGERR